MKNIKDKIYIPLLKNIVSNPSPRNFFYKKFEKKLYSDLVEKGPECMKQIQIKKYEFLMSMLNDAKTNLDKGFISKKVTNKVINTLVKNNFVRKENKPSEKFKEKYGIGAPTFIVLSPTQKCNLSCVGCYASSKINSPSLDFKTVDKICEEVYDKWGSRFMTISGGEPFMYKDDGKSLFDVWEKYSEMFFLVYTNGTLITKDKAEKLAELGNVTPAISVEGFEKETDERRGKGVYKKVLEAMKNLREAGVPFGTSVTSTTKNIDVLLEDKFYDFFFEKQGATYMWQFQLMPVGQAEKTKGLTITPKQRVQLYRKWEDLQKNKKYCIADFWNSGVLSGGCIAYGRKGGYLHVDWNGNIMPCVFVPYYEDNIKDLHKRGKSLTDALFSDLFVNGRKWQENYGLDPEKKYEQKPKNWLMPCSIRDHWKNFKQNILTENSKPEDIYAKDALESKEYDKSLTKFDEELKELTTPIWNKEY